MDCRRGRDRWSCRAGQSARPRQFRDLGAIAARHPGDASADRVRDRRRLAATPADGPRYRAVEPFWREISDPRGRPITARRDRSDKPDPVRVSPAGAVGTGQILGAAGRSQHPRRDDGRRAVGNARSHRTHVAPLWRQGTDRAGRGRRQAHHRRGPARTLGSPDRCPRRYFFGRVSADCGADRAGIGDYDRRRRAQSAARRTARMPDRDGRRYRPRERTRGGRRAGRRSARPRRAP